MQKQIDVTGPNGTFTGIVEVYFGPKTGIPFYVTATMGGKILEERVLRYDFDIWTQIMTVENMLVTTLNKMSVKEEENFYKKELKLLGYA